MFQVTVCPLFGLWLYLLKCLIKHQSKAVYSIKKLKALQFLSIKDNYKKMKVCNELQWQKEEEGANDDCLKPH